MASSRRELLRRLGRLVLAMPAGYAGVRLVGGCDDGGTACVGDAPIEESAMELVYSSSCAGAGPHFHMFVRANDEPDDPAAKVASRRTTTACGHVHEIAFTDDELETIASGGTVVKATTVVLEHSHSFAFRLP